MEKSTIVFIHGNSLSAKTFEKQIGFSSEFEYLALDLPGHGQNVSQDYSENDFCIESYVNIVIEKVSSCLSENILLVGHSLGGHIAIEAAPSLKKVKGLLIFGTPPVGKPPAMDKAFLPHPAMPFLFQEQWSDDELRQLIGALTKDKNIAEIIKRELLLSKGKARTGLLSCIGAGKHLDELDIVGNLKIPIAILHGENDSLINSHYFSEISLPTLWRNKLHVVPDAGHCLQMEMPRAFNDLLLQFCNEVL